MSIVNGFLTLKMKTVHFRLSEKASRCEQKGMSAYPSIVAKPMAVEPTTALESAAAQLEMDQQVLVSGAEVEQSPLQQQRVHKHVCTLMSMLCLVPNICRVSHSLYVPERVFPLYNKTGIAHFCKNMESPPVAPVRFRFCTMHA